MPHQSNYSSPRLSGYLACKALIRNSNSGMPRKLARQGSFRKKGQHANPVLTLRSSHSKAVSHFPVSARMHAI